MSEQSHPSARDELLFLAAQIRQFVRQPTKTTWADRCAFVLRVADRLDELAGTEIAQPAEAERSAA